MLPDLDFGRARESQSVPRLLGRLRIRRGLPNAAGAVGGSAGYIALAGADEAGWAEAVAIRDGKFLVVGSDAEAAAVTGTPTQTVDLAGRFAVPGAHDLHVRFEGFYNAAMLD